MWIVRNPCGLAKESPLGGSAPKVVGYSPVPPGSLPCQPCSGIEQGGHVAHEPNEQGALVIRQVVPDGDDAGQLDPALAKQLLIAYRNAPQPLPRPGLSPQDQQKLDVYVQGKKQSDEADLKAYLDTAVSQVARHNSVILKYRDELYRKLPRTPETFAAAMDDLMQRLGVVANDEELSKALVADVREWATLESRPPHVMNALARAARKLADAKGPQYYQSPYWHSSNVFAWRKTRGGVDGASALKDLAVYLEELAAQPQLEIKEKK